MAAVTTAVYLVLVSGEGDTAFWEVFPWAALMVLATTASLWSGLSRHVAVGRSMAIAAAAVLGALGVVALFSVGIGFMLAAILAAVAAILAASPPT